MRLDDVLEQLEQWSDDKDSERLTVDENVAAVKATEVVTVFISPPDNEIITDEDSGDGENIKLHNLPRNQIIVDATVAAPRTSAPAATGQKKLKFRN